MEAVFRKNLSRSYMCIEEQGQLVEEYELQMLENHKIPGLLTVQTVISEGKRRYLYDISGKQQMEDYFSGKKMDYESLQMFLFSIQQMCAGLSEYLLREEGICLEMRFIYVNLEDGSLQFTYLPFYDRNLPEAFEACMEQILRKIDHQDKAAVELGYQVYQLCSRGTADIGKLLGTALGKPLAFEEKERKEETKNTEETDDTEILEEKEKIWKDKIGKKKKQISDKVRKYLPGCSSILEKVLQVIREKRVQNMQGKSEFFGKAQKGQRSPGRRKKAADAEKLRRVTAVGEEDGLEYFQEADALEHSRETDVAAHPTEILGVFQQTPIGKLTYQGVHSCEDIVIQSEIFLLGKNDERVDGVILAEGVSRLHARITHQENKYYVEDLNSTNGTFVNDMELEYHQPQELKIGDKIRFGVEEYLFS